MITIAENEHIFDQTATSRVTDQIISKPDSVIGLSTGRTTGNMHRLIAVRCEEGDIDTSRVTFFGVDEITDVPRDYYGSCYRMIRSEMLDRMGFDDENFLMLPTFSDDFRLACEDFVKEIERRGGIDLLILGLGEKGDYKGITLGLRIPFGYRGRGTDKSITSQL